MKKLILAFLIIFLIAMPLLAGGGRDSGQSAAASSASAANVNPPGVLPICKTPVTLSLAMRMNQNVENYETNLYTKMIEEKGNIKFDIEVFPAGQPGTEKILVMVAAGGELPEILCNFDFSEEQVYALGGEGAFLKLNDYYDKWAHFFNIQLEKMTNKSLWQWLHSADGNIYYIPSIGEQIGEMYALRGWMNMKWLENLGLPVPATTEEFRQTLIAFRDRDPTRTGRRDLIPASGVNDERGRLADFLINAFIYNDQRDRLIVDNAGRVDVIFNKPEYREALRYVHGLMSEGLILDQLFTINAANHRAIIESNPNSATIGFFCQGLAGAISPNNQLRLEYAAIPPLKGPAGVQYTPFNAPVLIKRYVITKDCKNPEAAFRVGDYMCGEEASIWMRFGAPERDWRLPRPGEKSMYDHIGMAAVLSPILAWGSIQNSHWANGGPYMRPVGMLDGQVAPDNPLDNERWIAAAVPMYMDKAPPSQNRVDMLQFNYQEMEDIKDMKLAINTYVRESLALFVMGQRNIERDWDAYIRELDRMNLRRYIEITQSGYERAIGKKR